jgi:hypothetical protein
VRIIVGSADVVVLDDVTHPSNASNTACLHATHTSAGPSIAELQLHASEMSELEAICPPAAKQASDTPSVLRSSPSQSNRFTTVHGSVLLVSRIAVAHSAGFDAFGHNALQIAFKCLQLLHASCPPASPKKQCKSSRHVKQVGVMRVGGSVIASPVDVVLVVL